MLERLRLARALAVFGHRVSSFSVGAEGLVKGRWCASLRDRNNHLRECQILAARVGLKSSLVGVDSCQHQERYIESVD